MPTCDESAACEPQRQEITQQRGFMIVSHGNAERRRVAAEWVVKIVIFCIIVVPLAQRG